MSLEIQISQIRAVLLADGWHEIVPGSFDLDSYEFMDDCASGFTFAIDDPAIDAHISGPLTTILAVRHSSSRKAA